MVRQRRSKSGIRRKKKVRMYSKRRSSKYWLKVPAGTALQGFRPRFEFVDCDKPFEAVVVQAFSARVGVKNPEDHVILYAPRVPAGCPSHLFSLCRSLKVKLRPALEIGDRALIKAYKVTGRPRDFCKLSKDGVVQIMPKLDAKKVEVIKEIIHFEYEPAVVVNVFEHRFWFEAERLERKLMRDVSVADLAQKHVMRVYFLDEKLQVHHTYTPHATNEQRSSGVVVDYGPISTIRGTEQLGLERTVKRRRHLPRLIQESNFMAIRLARLRNMPAGSVVGSGFCFPPCFDGHLLPRTKDGRRVKFAQLASSRPAIVNFEVPRKESASCPGNIPGSEWMHKDVRELYRESVERQMKGVAFYEQKLYAAAIVGRHETHRRMVAASGRAGLKLAASLNDRRKVTFELEYEMSKVDPDDLDACKENNIKKSVASMWQKGSLFRISEDCYKRPFAEGCVLHLKVDRDSVTETEPHRPRGKRKRKSKKIVHRLIWMKLTVTADIWARDEDRDFSSYPDQLEQLLSGETREAVFMPDLDRTGFEEQIKTFGRRKLWRTFNTSSLNQVGQILRDVFCWRSDPQNIDTSDTVLQRREGQQRLDSVQLDGLKTMIASRGRACILNAPSGTGKTDMCTEFIAESLSRDWVEYGVRRSFPVIVFKSNANLVNAIRIMKKHIPDFKPVLLTSTSAGERLDDCDITPGEFKTLSSRWILRDYERFMLASVDRAAREFLEDYKAKHEAHSRRSYKEQKALTLLLQYYRPSAIFATSSTLEVYADVLCDKTTHMVIDEGGQFCLSTLLCLLCKFRSLEQLVISGDSKQLENYLKGIPEELWCYGGDSVMTLIEKGFPIVVRMNRNYRQERVLCDALSFAAYGGTLEHAGAGFPPKPSPDWRQIFKTAFPLPVSDVPIVLLDVCGRPQFAHSGTSRVNVTEVGAVVELVKALRRILGQRVSIAVLSPYLAQVIRLKDELTGHNCYVRTVDSFADRAADIVILSTVQSWIYKSGPPGPHDRDYDPEREKRALDHNRFFTHSGRAIGALSRAVHAFCLVGNMQAIEKNCVYKRFVHFAVQRTPVVNGNYLKLLQQSQSQWGRMYTESVLAEVEDADGTTVTTLAAINGSLLRAAKLCCGQKERPWHDASWHSHFLSGEKLQKT